MNRVLICLVIALGYVLFREPAQDATKPKGPVAAIASKMTQDERASLSLAYETLARSIKANPVDEPVFPDTAAVRRAHRAALLCVWQGALASQPGKYPGLREALEGEVEGSLGLDEVPLNPELQRRVADTFLTISASLK